MHSSTSVGSRDEMNDDPSAAVLDAFVERARAVFGPLELCMTDVIGLLVFRISVRSGDKFLTQADAGLAKYIGLFPELHVLEGREAFVFDMADRRGDAVRRRLGMKPVYAGDISGAAKDPKNLVGFVTVVGRVLVLEVLSSGKEDNITDDGDIDGLGGNAYTELVRAAVVAFDRQLVHVMFSRWDRFLRNARHGADLSATLSKRGHLITVWVDGAQTDIDSLGAELQGAVAVSDLKTKAANMFAGSYTKCLNNQWTKAEFQLPEGAATGVGATKNTVRWVPEQVAVVAELYALRAVGAPIAQVTERAVELGFRMRHPMCQRPDGTYPTLGELHPGTTSDTARTDRARREAVISNLFTTPKRRVYRTGIYPFRLVAPEPGKRTIEGRVVEFEDSAAPVWHAPSLATSKPKDLRYYGFKDFELRWGLPKLPEGVLPPIPANGDEDTDPVEGLNLRASQWEALELLYASPDLDADAAGRPALRASGGGAVSTDDDACRPFLGLATWLDTSATEFECPGADLVTGADGRAYRQVERKIGGGNPDALTVRERTPSDRGWGTTDGVLIATVPDAALAVSVAGYLRSLIDDARDGRIVFRETRRADAGDGALAQLHATLAQARREHEDFLATAKGHRAMAAKVAGRFADPMSEAADEAAAPFLDDALEVADQVRSKELEIARLVKRISRDSATTRRVAADLTHISVVADVLASNAERSRPRHVRELGDALKAIFRDTFRLVPDPSNHRLAWWSGTAHITVDGHDITHTAPPTAVINRRRPAGAGDSRELLTDALATLLLRDGHTLQHVLDFNPNTAASTALTALRSWFDAHGVAKRGLRDAIIDCPIPATKLAAWGTLAADQPSAGHLIEGFRCHIVATYTSEQTHKGRWVQRDTTLSRRAINALLAMDHPEAGALVDDLARAIGVTPAEIARLTPVVPPASSASWCETRPSRAGCG